MEHGAVVQLLVQRPVVALVYGGGVATSLTPCIYPMIPITAAVVGGQSAGRASLGRVAALTAAYVLGLALFYALLGLFAGLTGTLFGSVSTNPWLYLLVANLLAAFGLMMLDVLPVPVPSARIARAGRLGGGGRYAGVFTMGAASGLVAAPCGALVLATLLTWVAATKSATHRPGKGIVRTIGRIATVANVDGKAVAAYELPHVRIFW